MKKLSFDNFHHYNNSNIKRVFSKFEFTWFKIVWKIINDESFELAMDRWLHEILCQAVGVIVQQCVGGPLWRYQFSLITFVQKVFTWLTRILNSSKWKPKNVVYMCVYIIYIINSQFISWTIFFNKNHWLLMTISIFYINNWNLKKFSKFQLWKSWDALRPKWVIISQVQSLNLCNIKFWMIVKNN